MSRTQTSPVSAAARAVSALLGVYGPSGRAGAGRGRSALRGLLAVLAAAGLGLAIAPGATAATTRPLLASFGPDGTSASSFSAVSQLAFNQSSGRLYALDAGASEIYGFEVSTPGSYTPLGGSFPLSVEPAGGAPDIAVDNTLAPSSSAGDLYYVSEFNESVYGYSATGAALGGNFPIAVEGDICGAAVDPSGNVWVGDYANQEIREYDSSGNPIGTVSTAAQGSPCHVAFDSAGDMYVAMYYGAVWEYSAASGYTSASEIDSGSANAITVDRATGELYVAHTSEIDAYDAAGSAVGSFGTEVSGASWSGVAVDEESGEVYAADAGNQSIAAFGPQTTVPDVSTGTASAATTTSATLHGTVDPDEIQLTDCHFEYGTSTSYGQSAPCVPAAASIPADSTEHQVSAEISGLTPGSLYHFRLVAANAGGANQGADETLSTGAAIDSETVESVSSEGATVAAEINPHGAATTYHVEYGATSAYGQSTSESAPIGSDDSDHKVTVELSGLPAGTTWHFRFVVTNAAGVTHGSDSTLTTFGPPAAFAACPNDALRIGYSAYLPDCRAYEQASPISKNGGAASGGLDAVQAAAGGGAVTFASMAPMPGSTGAQQFPQIYLASRNGEEGWSTQGLYPPASAGSIAEVLGWTPDLAYAIDSAQSQGGAGNALLLRSLSDGAITTIVPPTAKASYYFAGASADDSKIFFEATGAQLTPEAAAEEDNLYAWDRDTGNVSLVGVLPSAAGGGAPAGGSFAGPYNWWGGELSDGGAKDRYYTQEMHAISTDGARAYYTAGGTGQIYLRENPTAASAKTVQVSASQKTNGTGPAGTDPNGTQPAAFGGASADGSQAFFTSSSELTDDANTGSADQGSDLYRYEVASGNLTDLTPDASDSHGAEVQGVLGTSEDGSYVYFAANGVLAAGAELGDCHGEGEEYFDLSGSCSLYVWHDGATSFIARLDTFGEDYSSDAANWVSTAQDSPVPHERTARVTPDGTTLLFRSQSQLTSYDNQGECSGGVSVCPEFYRYSASDGQIDCVSCAPTGVSPVSAPTLQSISTFGGYSGAAVATRNLSASGDQVFFETSEALVGADTNGVQDVYEWEADGAGSCTSDDQDGGCVYLLSTGRGAQPSYFADASSSGADAFFFTEEQLVGQDGDTADDLYDARVEGGIGGQNPAAEAACAGEECKHQANSAASVSAPGSATFSGPGDQSQKRTCAPTDPSAQQLTQKARKLRKQAAEQQARAKRASKHHQAGKDRRLRNKARRLRKKANRHVKQAKRAKQKAKLCRRTAK
jgi:hypothetical protein